MTLVLEDLQIPGYERVVQFADPSVALKGLIAIHSTALGPSLGGIRMYPYDSFDEALTDVLRLSEGMTYKAALAECGTGGGKSVIIADPAFHKTEALFRVFGRVVDKLQGAYICAEDVGISPDDVNVIHESTKYVVGLHKENSSGNPAPYTAWGTLRGIQAALQHRFGSESLVGKTVAVQGLGAVGFRLAEMLFWRGAQLVVADVNPRAVAQACTQFAAQEVSVEEIHAVQCDVFAPCALGSILDDTSIPELGARIVAGCANNQLNQPKHAHVLKNRGVLYAPDFVLNAGGLINVCGELEMGGYNPYVARQRVDKIFEQLTTIFDISASTDASTHEAAFSLAEYRLKYHIGRREETIAFDHVGARL